MIFYYLAEGLRNIGRNKLLNLSTIFTIAVSMTIFGFFLILFLNLKDLHESWSERFQITVYLKDGTDEKHLIDTIRKEKEVSAVIYTSKENALLEFQKELGKGKGVLNTIGDNPLPASIDITLKKEYRLSEFIEPLVEMIRKLPGVEEVHYGEDWIREITVLLKGLKITGILLGSFLIAGVIFIISNTIRLALYTRQEEIEIMKLIGATRGFIRWPFVVEGVLQGLTGGASSILFLYGFYRIVAYGLGLNFPGFHPAFLNPLLLAGIFFSGLILGLLGSLFSMGRFLK